MFCEDGSMFFFVKEYEVAVADAEDSAIVLHTYETHAEEDLAIPYTELMQRNLEALVHSKLLTTKNPPYFQNEVQWIF